MAAFLLRGEKPTWRSSKTRIILCRWISRAASEGRSHTTAKLVRTLSPSMPSQFEQKFLINPARYFSANTTASTETTSSPRWYLKTEWLTASTALTGMSKFVNELRVKWALSVDWLLDWPWRCYQTMVGWLIDWLIGFPVQRDKIAANRTNLRKSQNTPTSCWCNDGKSDQKNTYSARRISRRHRKKGKGTNLEVFHARILPAFRSTSATLTLRGNPLIRGDWTLPSHIKKCSEKQKKIIRWPPEVMLMAVLTARGIFHHTASTAALVL